MNWQQLAADQPLSEQRLCSFHQGERHALLPSHIYPPAKQNKTPISGILLALEFCDTNRKEQLLSVYQFTGLVSGVL